MVDDEVIGLERGVMGETLNEGVSGRGGGKGDQIRIPARGLPPDPLGSLDNDTHLPLGGDELFNLGIPGL